MSSISDIPVQMEAVPAATDNTMVAAVVQEIIQLLDHYLGSGECGAIDIRSLPLSPDGHRQLQQTLGRGEIRASAELGGDSEVYETAYAGVWWITHRNQDGSIIAEQLEVTAIPAILCSHHEDIQQGRKRLDEITGLYGTTDS